MSESNEQTSIEGKPSTPSSDFLHEYLQKTNLSTRASLNQYVKDNRISRDANETDEEFTKRVKKINYLNLAQQLIRNSNQHANGRQINKTEPKSPIHDTVPKSMAPIKRMKPVFSPAEDPDFDDEFEVDEDNSRDIYDESSSSNEEDGDDHDDYDDDQDINYRRTRSVPSKTNHNFANDIKQKLSSLAADVVRTFGTSNMNIDDDLTKPLPTTISFSSRLFPNRIKETNNQSNALNNDYNFTEELSSQTNRKRENDRESNNNNDDADLLYTNESLLPQVDWENLERQLKEAQMERERYDKARLNDRDEIRRKLAAGNESEGENEDYYTSDYIKKTIATTSHRRRQGSNLQICFVNEHHQASESTDNDKNSRIANAKSDDINSSTATTNNDDILTKQQKLQEEAKVALVLGAKMARMQVQIERRALKKKKSPLYDIIGINTNGDKPLTLRMLEDMNIGQLQVIVNDLHCQIEAHNEELVSLLMERDSLSMEQDSILVDIEDLTKRLQERAANSMSPELKRSSTNGTTQRVYIVKSPTKQQQQQQQDVQKKSIFHNLLRKATFT